MRRDAGRKIEKNVKNVKSYVVAISFACDTDRNVTRDNRPAWHSSAKVKRAKSSLP